jgi:PAS domain S-box-containing protein
MLFHIANCNIIFQVAGKCYEMINSIVTGRAISILRSVLMIFLLIIVMVPIASSAQNEEVTIRVGVYDNPPKVYLDENGECKGFFPEIIELVARNESWNIEYVFGEWSTCLDRLESGEIDVMVDVAYSENRANIYDFNNETVFNNWGVVYITPDSTIASLTDLEGKKVAVMNGSIHTEGERGIKALTKGFDINCTFVEVNSYHDVLASIDSRSVDAGVVNRLFGESEKNKFNIERTNIIFNPIELKFAFHKNAAINTVLIEGIDSNLKQMKEDKNSQYYTLIDKYLLAATDQKEVIIPEWVLPAFGFGIIVIVSLFFVSITFRWQVNKKTEDLKVANQSLEAEIKKQRETAGKLRESESRFKIVASNTPDYIVMQDKQLKYLFVVNSPLGLPEEEMLGKTDYSFLPEEEADKLARIKEEVMETGRLQHFESALTSKDGSPEFFEGTYVPRYDNNGKIDGVIGYFRNVTKRKHAEEELLDYRNHLEKIVEVRTADLQASQQELVSIVQDLNRTSEELKKANVRLQELDRLKSMFIASTSHELRTPLNSIIGFSSVLLEGWSGELNHEQKEQLQIVLSSGKHLLSLINDVIDISKIEAGKLEIYNEEFNLADIMDEASSLVKKDAEEKGLELKTEMPDITLYSDRRRLLQCIINLLSNSVKYSEKGSVELKAKQNDGFVDISVSDTGIGIKEEDLQKLFKAFTRLESHLTESTSGTGLGLYLTDKLVREVLKGTLDVTSKYGEGSTFTLHIPVKEEEQI